VVGEFRYRGVSSGHPNLRHYLLGNIFPGDVNGTISAADHNEFGDDPIVQSQSPYTSWTADRDLAIIRAGKGGLVLCLPTGLPPAGASWAWVASPDKFFESEVLLWGTRSGAGVSLP